MDPLAALAQSVPARRVPTRAGSLFGQVEAHRSTPGYAASEDSAVVIRQRRFCEMCPREEEAQQQTKQRRDNTPPRRKRCLTAGRTEPTDQGSTPLLRTPGSFEREASTGYLCPRPHASSRWHIRNNPPIRRWLPCTTHGSHHHRQSRRRCHRQCIAPLLGNFPPSLPHKCTWSTLDNHYRTRRAAPKPRMAHWFRRPTRIRISFHRSPG